MQPDRRLHVAWIFAGVSLASIVVASQLRADETLLHLEGDPLAPIAIAPDTSATARDDGEDPRTTPTAAPAGTAARSAELDAASTVDALKALAARFPKDTKVWRKLALTQFEGGAAIEAAVGSAKQAFLLDETVADEDERMRTLVLRAASGPPNAADMAFEILADHTGATGPDLLYELTKAKSVSDKVKDRAKIALQWPRVRERMTPALLIAMKLSDAKSVCERATLAATAEKDGDARSLVYLEGSLGQVCDKFNFIKLNCQSCVGDGSMFHRAIRAIRERAKGASPGGSASASPGKAPR